MTTTISPEAITWDVMKKWSPSEMRETMKHPEKREIILEIIKNRNLEEVLDAQKQMEQQDEVPVQVAEEISPAEVVEQPVAEVPVEAPKKIIVDYQVKDEDGNPIGRPTHLEAVTEEEMRGKIIECHVQATRWGHRLKKQKLSFKEAPVATAPTTASDAELLSFMKDLKSDDPEKQLAAIKKVQQVETAKAKAESDQKLAEVEETRRQEKVSTEFLRRHKHDFNNCQANVNLVKEYFENQVDDQGRQLAWTLDNLELAFHDLESELAPVVEPVPPAAPANPVAPPAVAITTAAPTAVQPQVTAPAQVVAPANPVVTTPRPGVNGGLVPGQTSSLRPTTQSTPNKLTVEEVNSWDGPTMRKKMRNPVDRARIVAFAAERSQIKK